MVFWAALFFLRGGCPKSLGGENFFIKFGSQFFLFFFFQEVSKIFGKYWENFFKTFFLFKKKGIFFKRGDQIFVPQGLGPAKMFFLSSSCFFFGRRGPFFFGNFKPPQNFYLLGFFYFLLAKANFMQIKLVEPLDY